ncbi:uncharacterized protein LOC144863516 [Branchiostoma floridae x Branchiostoma japonicum]
MIRTAVVSCLLFLSVLPDGKAVQGTSCAEVCSHCRPTSYAANCDTLNLTYVPTNFPVNAYSIRLDWNELKFIPTTSFLNVPLVTSLNLSYNKIRDIEKRAFKNLPKVRTIDLTGNRLTHIGDDVFGLPRLHFLYLQNNSISNITATAFSEASNKLNKVYLSDNCLEEIPWQSFQILKMISEVNFDRNKIRTSSVPSELQTLMPFKVSVRQNPWHCDCELFSFVNWLHQGNYVNSPYCLACASRDVHEGKNLTTLCRETLCDTTLTTKKMATSDGISQTAKPNDTNGKNQDSGFSTFPIVNYTISHGNYLKYTGQLNVVHVNESEESADYVLLLPIAETFSFESNGPHQGISCIVVLVASALGFAYFLYQIIRHRKTVKENAIAAERAAA